jgi:hypothetical protein
MKTQQLLLLCSSAAASLFVDANTNTLHHLKGAMQTGSTEESYNFEDNTTSIGPVYPNGRFFACGPVGQPTTASIYALTNNTAEETFVARATFIFGDSYSYNVDKEFPANGEKMMINTEHVFTEPGVYKLGIKANITMPGGISQIFQAESFYQIYEDSCTWGTPSPTPPPTERPTMKPDPSSSSNLVVGGALTSVLATAYYLM